jgi:hypothetical protein
MGEHNVGGAFGEIERTSLNSLNYLDVNLSFDTSGVLRGNYDGAHYNFGGVTGISYFTTYINVFIQVNINNINNINIIQSPIRINNTGGLAGYNEFDRLFNVNTTGIMTFTPDQESFDLENLGGVSGYAFNTSYFDVVNEIDISLIMGDSYELMYFESIGGLIGVASFVNLERVYNLGNVHVIPPTNGFDYCIYFNVNNCDEENDFDFYPEFPIEYVGGLIGYIEGSAYIRYSANLGNIIGIVEVGGLIGSSGGGYGPYGPGFSLQHDLIIQQAFNDGLIAGIGFVGGIMGLTDEITNLIIANTYNSGDVYADGVVGGILGLASPAIGIEIMLINTYNSGDIYVSEEIAGGLIGAAGPLYVIGYFSGYPFYDFFDFMFGSIEIYNSFNVGEIILDPQNLDSVFGSASVIGFRLTQTRMYGVSFLQQFVEYDDMGVLRNFPLLGASLGNNVDMKAITLEDSFLYFVDAQFIYRSAWNFTYVWEWLEGSTLPTLQNLF